MPSERTTPGWAGRLRRRRRPWQWVSRERALTAGCSVSLRAWRPQSPVSPGNTQNIQTARCQAQGAREGVMEPKEGRVPFSMLKVNEVTQGEVMFVMRWTMGG